MTTENCAVSRIPAGFQSAPVVEAMRVIQDELSRVSELCERLQTENETMKADAARPVYVPATPFEIVIEGVEGGFSTQQIIDEVKRHGYLITKHFVELVQRHLDRRNYTSLPPGAVAVPDDNPDDYVMQY